MSNRPNILYIHSHDTGRWVQPYGFAVETPNLQKLAGQGILFRRAYCANPTCSPSRACLMSGQWAHTNGMLGLAHRGFRARDYSRFLPNTLRAAGYATALAGIQHEAHPPTAELESLGYDHFLNHREDGWSQHARTAEAAIEFLSRAKSPFFLSVGFFETHRAFPDNEASDGDHVLPPAPLPDVPEVRQDIAGFFAMARTLDEKMGRVLAALDQNGLAENTLVICTTDHGPALPNMKCNLTDAGIGVMLMLRGPGGFTGGQVRDGMVTHLDLYPTICELLGIDGPGNMQGKSLLPIVRNHAHVLHDEIFAEVNYHAAYEPQRCVRTDRYKYIRRLDGRSKPVLPNCDDGFTKEYLLRADWIDQPRPAEMLFDLAFDPAETNNGIDDPAYANVAREMRQRLVRWMSETNDPLIHGPIPPPPGSRVNDADGNSPEEKARQY